MARALFAVCILFLYELHGIHGSKQTTLNRLTCQNAFTAHNHGLLDECVNEWVHSPWGQYSEDATYDCEFCKIAASFSWDEKLSPLICHLWNDPSECHRILTSLSRLRDLENRDVVLCNVLTVCNSHGYIKDLDFSSNLCDDCKKIIQDVKQLVQDNATSEQIVKKMDEYICSSLPNGIKDYCQNMVKVHVPALLHCIDAKIDPMTICSIIGLCQQMKTSLKLKDFMPGSKVDLVQTKCPHKCPKQTHYSWISRPPIPNNHMWTSKIVEDIPSCQPCQDVFNQVKSVLQDPKMQTEIKQIIDQKVCANMGFSKRVCQTIINHNFDTILQALFQLDPRDACAVFKMCTKSQTPTVIHEVLKPVQLNIPVPGVCRFCEVIVHKLFDMLAANQTEQSLYNGMKAMCELIPSKYRTECSDFVKKYGVQIVKAIIEGTAPAIICASFGLCSEPPVPVMNVIEPTKTTADFCTPCKFAVETIYLQLRNNATEDEIRKALDRFCELLPPQYTDQCKEYVNAYLDIIIQYMENNLTPEQVCQLLQLCPQSNSYSLSEKNPCLLGPQYWCSNHITAKRCGATYYCDNFKSHINRPSAGNQPQTLCSYMDLSTICVNFDLAKQCDRVQDCVAFKLKRYFDLLFKPPKHAENCSVCEQITTRWRLQSRILGGAIVNSSICTTYEGSKRYQCELVHEKHGEILEKVRLQAGEPDQICARTIGCVPTPVTKDNNRDILYPDVFYDKSFNPLNNRKPFDWHPSKSSIHSNEAVNYFGSLDEIANNKETEPNLAPTPIASIKETLVGTDRCSWGPSYWCLSYENAKKCPNALEHCRTKVWTNGIPDFDPAKPLSQSTKPPPFGPGSVDPIYCCQSAINARRCGPKALKFCMQQVWSNKGKNMAN